MGSRTLALVFTGIGLALTWVNGIMDGSKAAEHRIADDIKKGNVKVEDRYGNEVELDTKPLNRMERF